MVRTECRSEYLDMRKKKYSEDREICVVMSYTVHNFTKHY